MRSKEIRRDAPLKKKISPRMLAMASKLPSHRLGTGRGVLWRPGEEDRGLESPASPSRGQSPKAGTLTMLISPWRAQRLGAHRGPTAGGGSPVRGQGGGRRRGGQGFPCGPVRWAVGRLPCGESQRGLGSLTLRPGHRASPPTFCTIKLLQAFTVILGQAVLVRVAHWALVKGPHDGVGR